jgi:glycerophosphoryl diester phosphodiesterase
MDTHPENTLAAFREAVRLGAHMVELDVRLTKDGHLVILHDETLDRTTNGEGKISEMTLEEVKDLDAGSWKSANFTGERVPELSEVLEIMPDHIWLNIHLKGGRRLGEKVARVIVDENRIHQAFLACESAAASGAKEVSQDILICNMERQGDRTAYIDETIRQGSEFIQLLGRRTDQYRQSDMARLQELDIRVNYCCTDIPADVNLLFSRGVDFILTDKLAEMLETAASAGINPAKY